MGGTPLILNPSLSHLIFEVVIIFEDILFFMVVLIFKVIFINSINILDLSKITTTSLVQPKSVTHSLTHKYAPFLLCIDTLYYTGYYTDFVQCVHY